MALTGIKPDITMVSTDIKGYILWEYDMSLFVVLLQYTMQHDMI